MNRKLAKELKARVIGDEAEENLARRIADLAGSFDSIDAANLRPLKERIGDKKIVLLGEDRLQGMRKCVDGDASITVASQRACFPAGCCCQIACSWACRSADKAAQAAAWNERQCRGIFQLRRQRTLHLIKMSGHAASHIDMAQSFFAA